MKKRNITIFGLFLIVCILSYGQPICDTLPSELIKEYDSYSNKQFHKLKKQKKLAPIKAFEIATYLRQKGDTTCKQWYALVISQHKKYPYYYGDKFSFIEAPHLLFYLAQSNYFIGEYEQAYKWYIIAYKWSYSGSCHDYYYEDVKKKLRISE
jgi:hypothetical protein